VPGPAGGEHDGLRASFPASHEAARLYAEGLARLRNFDALEARTLLQQAVQVEPEFPLSHAALAEAWSQLGYDGEARAAIRHAHDLSAGLPREAHLTVEARYRESLSEWDETARLYGVLYGFFPDNIDHGLNFARASTRAGRANRALETLARLRRLPPPAALDPRIDLGEAETAVDLGQHARSRDAARRAAGKGAAQGAILLVARARVTEAHALNRLGEPAAARAVGELARDIYSRVGDRGGYAWATNRIGGSFLYEGRLIEALNMFEQAQVAFEDVGYQSGLAAAHNNIGYTLLLQGRLDTADPQLRTALGIDREREDRRGQTFVLLNIGLLRDAQGDLMAARESYDQSLAMLDEIDDDLAWPIATHRRADVLLQEGWLEEADASYAKALPALQRAAGERFRAAALYGPGQLHAARGEFALARQRFEEALSVFRELGDETESARHRTALARLALREGDSDTAALAARVAAEAAAREGCSDLEAEALLVLAEALRLQASTDLAMETLSHAEALTATSQSRRVRLLADVTAGRLLSAAGRGDEAMRRLRGAVQRATEHGHVALSLEARLALGHAMAQAAAPEARSLLADLASDARGRGFHYVAETAERRLETLS
jgi:tetratricopeptide (TPR) repeat protein